MVSEQLTAQGQHRMHGLPSPEKLHYQGWMGSPVRLFYIPAIKVQRGYGISHDS